MMKKRKNRLRSAALSLLVVMAVSGFGTAPAVFAAEAAPDSAEEPLLTASETADSVISCGDTIHLYVGQQKTVYLRSGSFVSFSMDNPEIASIQSVSHNVLNITARSAGTAILTTVDSAGTRRQTTIQADTMLPVSPDGDYAAFTCSKTPLSSELNPVSMIRRMTITTGTTLRFADEANPLYQYRYEMRHTSGRYITLKKPSDSSEFAFCPTKTGTYRLKLKVTNVETKQSGIEIFVLTVQGQNLSDQFADTCCTTPLKLEKGSRTKLQLPDTIRTVWRSNTNVSYAFSGQNLTLKTSEDGYTELLILTSGGVMYPLTIKTGEVPGFVLSADTLSLDNGKKKTLPIENVSPGITLSYHSANTGIAAVSSSGSVTGVSCGKTSVTVTASDGTTATVHVTVNTSRITLNKTSALIKPGSTLQLKATMDSGSFNTYTYYSTNVGTATVDKTGKVTAVGKGSTVIRVTTDNGKTAECTVTVSNTTPYTTVKFLAVPPTVHVGKTVTVDVTASDASVNDEIKVFSSDAKIASVSYKNGTVTIRGKSMGKATITISLPNGKKAAQYVYSIGRYNDYRTNYMVEKGIDVSCYNIYTDYKALKRAGYTFVIIRAGFGNDISQKDELFEEHIKGAKEAGLGIGVYYFSYAVNAADAKKEAEVCCRIIKKYRNDIKYGVYYDYEDDSTRYATNLGYTVNKSVVTAMTVAFCKEVERNGFMAGVYTNTSYGTAYLDMDQISQFLFWYAAPYATTFAFDFDIWQYSFTVSADGIYGVADGNKVFSTVFNLMK